MDNFLFYSPTEFRFGRGAENEAGECAARYGAKRVIIVYGGGSAVRSGVLARVENSLKKSGVEFTMLGGIQPNPTDKEVYEGIDIGSTPT